ncbi:DUF3906 family protein [Paenibacillus abyssi]|uniref:DUF3906 domain-containing protein n=1 Tax=Paenibacillus abyssi TaxID=1340531 RepID=A0A917LDR1_9BACL|nr:DUF3906 family protein [Paenibacillus abyssi]GGG15504.1 hypothetical protein GCM10010916_35550 [Paenibacillus abyssi]
MFLYKIEIEYEEKIAYLIVLADSDEKAFATVEGNAAKHFVKTPDIRSIAIIEKKRTEPGNGYLIEVNG